MNSQLGKMQILSVIEESRISLTGQGKIADFIYRE